METITKEKILGKCGENREKNDDSEKIDYDGEDSYDEIYDENGASAFEQVNGDVGDKKQPLLNFRPPLFVAVALAFGVLSSALTLLSGFYTVLVTACVVFLFLSVFVILRRKSTICIVTIFCSVVMFFVGFFSVCAKFDSNLSKKFSDKTYTSGEGIVASSVKTKDGGFVVYLRNFNSYDGSISGGVAVKTTADFDRGRILSVSGYAAYEQVSFDNLQPVTKEYDYFFSYADVQAVGDDKNFFTGLSRRVGKAVLKNTDDSSGGVLVALLLGETKYIDENIYENFSVSGVAHIFAVSGLHIGFLAAALGFLLDKLKVGRLLKTSIVFFVTLFYSGICGFTVSSLRAVIMCAVFGFTKSSGVKYDLLNSISFAFIIVICAFPESLFSYGTVLSFGSVISIALLAKTFEDAFAFVPIKIRTPLAVSASAFTGTFPVVAKMLGQTSVITILINLVTIPLVSVLFVLTFIGGWLSAVTDFFAFLLVPSNVIARIVSDVYGFLNVEQLVVPVAFSFIPTAILYIDVMLVTDRLNFPAWVKKAGLIALPFLFLLFI